jgi:glycosyltransferase involved in cell wall biosynthesis
VLHVITRLIVGGAQENTLLTVIGQQADPRFRVTLLSGIDLGPEGNLHERARAAGVELLLVPWLVRPIRPWTDLRALVALWRLMRHGRYHVVHTHSSKAGILGRVAARLAGVPVVVHTLHSLVFHEYQSAWANRLYVALKRAVAPLTDTLISVNEMTARGALRAGIGRAEQHVTIFSGMELAPFLDVGRRLTPQAARRAFGLPEDALVVGKVARLFPLKGHELFLEAAGEIARREARARFLVVGGGVLREPLEAQAERLAIRERTVFTGLLAPERVPDALQAMDVVVHTSLREGIARVIPQAGAVGKPVVCFALDGAPEVVREGVSGHLVPPRDTHALADRVVELLADPARRAAMGAAGRDFAAAHFSAAGMVDAVSRVHLAALARRGLK